MALFSNRAVLRIAKFFTGLNEKKEGGNWKLETGNWKLGWGGCAEWGMATKNTRKHKKWVALVGVWTGLQD
jgi:hypothetical protein